MPVSQHDQPSHFLWCLNIFLPKFLFELLELIFDQQVSAIFCFHSISVAPLYLTSQLISLL